MGRWCAGPSGLGNALLAPRHVPSGEEFVTVRIVLMAADIPADASYRHASGWQFHK
jgi:hypothetical protein